MDNFDDVWLDRIEEVEEERCEKIYLFSIVNKDGKLSCLTNRNISFTNNEKLRSTQAAALGLSFTGLVLLLMLF